MTAPPPVRVRRSLIALARAAASGRRARVAIQAASGHGTETEVDVLALGWRWGGWVAAVRCVRRDALRLLRVERIVRVRAARHPASSASAGSFHAREFAAADLLDPEAGPLRSSHIDLPPPLLPLAAALFPGARVEPRPAGARLHLEATNLPALRALAASLGLAVG